MHRRRLQTIRRARSTERPQMRVRQQPLRLHPNRDPPRRLSRLSLNLNADAPTNPTSNRHQPYRPTPNRLSDLPPGHHHFPNLRLRARPHYPPTCLPHRCRPSPYGPAAHVPLTPRSPRRLSPPNPTYRRKRRPATTQPRHQHRVPRQALQPDRCNRTRHQPWAVTPTNHRKRPDEFEAERPAAAAHTGLIRRESDDARRRLQA